MAVLQISSTKEAPSWNGQYENYWGGGGLKLVSLYQPLLYSDVDQDSTMFSDKCRKVSVNYH